MIYFLIYTSFEGGCKYPYVSEVARSGVGWYCFFLGAILGGVPWILFSFSYFHTFSQYAFMISSHFKRLLFLTMQYITLVFNILSALGMIATAFFDMGHYPLTHEFVYSLSACYIVGCFLRCSSESTHDQQFGRYDSVCKEN